MTNLAKAIIKPGTICFYGLDPVQHGALLVFVAGDRVTAYSSAKAMKLDYDAQDLIGPDELATQAKGILERKDHDDWATMVAGRLDALAAGLNLQSDKDINLAVRIDQLSGVIKDRLATNASIAMGQPQAPESICCHKCADGKTVGGFPISTSRMILCPDCRNKRCPRASDHGLACTGSNESGQPGSVFAKAELPKSPADAKVMIEAFIANVAKP
jgi:hypothetical protein